tara:strand:+ start:37 stop:798 length:762 start_codon:yes stop_codon:yes gene_type:complete
MVKNSIGRQLIFLIILFIVTASFFVLLVAGQWLLLGIVIVIFYFTFLHKGPNSEKPSTISITLDAKDDSLELKDSKIIDLDMLQGKYQYGLNLYGEIFLGILSLWMAITPIIIVLDFDQQESSGFGINTGTFMAFSPIMLIFTLVGIFGYKERFFLPMIRSVAFSLPISIWQYFNEIVNGCTYFGIGEPCPPPPPIYDLPHFLMQYYIIMLGIYAISQMGREKKIPQIYGIAFGIGFSFALFQLAGLLGWFAR